MTYATGGGGNVADLVNAIRDFAVGLGWTNVKQGTSASGGYLFLEKGVAHITLQYATNNTVISFPTPGGSGVSIPDHRIVAHANTSINTGLTTWYGHPGYARGGAEDFTYAAITNDLTGPLSAWHLFSNATGDYIHVAVQTTSDRYAHFSFGLLDKGPLTHSGAAFVSGHNHIWYPNFNGIDPSAGSLRFNKPSLQPSPFNDSTSLYVPNALPAGYGTEVSSYSSSAPLSIMIKPIVFFDRPEAYPDSTLGGGLLDHVLGASTAGWSGEVPLYGAPSVIRNILGNRHCMIGMFPDVRFLNMDGMIPGQEIALTTDTWKIFPIMRQEAWASSGTQFRATTGQYALAYKKIS